MSVLNQIASANGIGQFAQQQFQNKLAQQDQQMAQQGQQQRNTLFQQGQEDRQSQQDRAKREQELAGPRQDFAMWAMAHKQGRGQEVWPQIAQKYGLDPSSDPLTVLPQFIQQTPDFLPPEIAQKVMQDLFTPTKPQGLTNVSPGGVVFDQDSRQPIYTAPREAPQQRPDNAVVPVADANSPTGFVYERRGNSAGKPAPAPRAQTSGRYSSKELQQARDKIRVLGVAKQQLANLKAQRDKIKDSFASGPGMGMVTPLSEDGSNFDSAVDMMRDTITGLTRTPGVGAMSDFETRLSQAKLPTRNEFESSRDLKIQGLEDFILNLESGYLGLLEEGQQPAGVDPNALDPQDLLDAADAILGGQ